jgi:hypothetical protein
VTAGLEGVPCGPLRKSNVICAYLINQESWLGKKEGNNRTKTHHPSAKLRAGYDTKTLRKHEGARAHHKDHSVAEPQPKTKTHHGGAETRRRFGKSGERNHRRQVHGRTKSDGAV